MVVILACFHLRNLYLTVRNPGSIIFTTSPDRLISEYEFRPLFEEQVRAVRGTNPRQTRNVSTQLLNKIEEHTGVFLSRGTNEKGQQVFGFLHPTFAEYLTARYLAYHWLETHQIEIADVLHEAAWHEVVLLTAGHLGTLEDILATQFIEYIERLDTIYEPYLHRNLLLVAEILGDKVPVSRIRLDAIVSRLISLALETPFDYLWQAILNKLADIAQSNSFANQPTLLKSQKGDTLALKVRKTSLSRAMGFQNEADLETFWRGIEADKETAHIALSQMSMFKRSHQTLLKHHQYILIILGKDWTSEGLISEQAVESYQKSQLPVLKLEDLAGNSLVMALQQNSTQAWILDKRKPPNPVAIAELIKNGPEGRRKKALLRAIIRNANYVKMLQDLVKQVTSKHAEEDYRSVLDILDQLMNVDLMNIEGLFPTLSEAGSLAEGRLSAAGRKKSHAISYYL